MVDAFIETLPHAVGRAYRDLSNAAVPPDAAECHAHSKAFLAKQVTGAKSPVRVVPTGLSSKEHVETAVLAGSPSESPPLPPVDLDFAVRIYVRMSANIDPRNSMLSFV